MRRIDRLHDQAVIEIQLELDGADQGEPVRPRVRRLQRGGPAHAEVIHVHIRARGALAPVGVERGVGPLEQRGARHRAAGEEGHVESGPPARVRQDPGGDGVEHREAVRQVGAERVQDARARRDGLADASQRCHGIRRDSVVIAEQHAPLVGVRPDDRDRSEVAPQRQQVARVLEQHHGLARHLERQGPVGRLVEHADRDLRPAHGGGRVEHAEPEPRHEQAGDRGVDGLLTDQALVHRIHQVRVLAAAIQVGAGADAQRGRRGGGRGDPVALVDVIDGTTIGHDVTGEAPLPPQDGPQQQVAAAGRRAEHPVVRAHQGVGARLANAGLEVGQVALAQVSLAHHGVELVAQRLGTRVDGEVLHGRDSLEIPGIVALEPADERHGEPPGEVGVFAVGLLAASPPRVAEQVDVGRPDGEALIPLVLAPAHVVLMFRAKLVGDDGGHAEHEARVPRRGEADGLWKHGREPRARDAVQPLVPPVVLRDPQALDRRRTVHHLGDFLLERHAPDQVRGAALERQARVLPGGRLRGGAPGDRGGKQGDYADDGHRDDPLVWHPASERARLRVLGMARTFCETEDDLMSQFRKYLTPLVLAGSLVPAVGAAQAEPWAAPVRGSWVRTGLAARGDVVLASRDSGAEIVVGAAENLNVRQAAVFLAGDIETISGYRPPIVTIPTTGRTSIRLVTVANGTLPAAIDAGTLRGQWEAYRVVTAPRTVWLVGSNPRGTAFAAYTLSERLGVDPLYLWTGYVPEPY